MKIAIGSDHTGVEYKKIIKKVFSTNHQIIDFGTNEIQAVDYPDFIHPVAKSIKSRQSKLGIILCGSGNGAAMTANKYKEVRAALIWDKEQARLAKAHNNANIISIPARFVNEKMLIEMIEIFLHTDFEGGRHQIRIDKISIKN